MNILIMNVLSMLGHGNLDDLHGLRSCGVSTLLLGIAQALITLFQALMVLYIVLSE